MTLRREAARTEEEQATAFLEVARAFEGELAQARLERDDALSRNTSLEEQLRQAHAEISRGQAQLAASEAMCTSLQRELESVPRLEPPSPSAASAGAQLGRSKQLVMAYREARATSAVAK